MAVRPGGDLRSECSRCEVRRQDQLTQLAGRSTDKNQQLKDNINQRRHRRLEINRCSPRMSSRNTHEFRFKADDSLTTFAPRFSLISHRAVCREELGSGVRVEERGAEKTGVVRSYLVGSRRSGESNIRPRWGNVNQPRRDRFRKQLASAKTRETGHRRET